MTWKEKIEQLAALLEKIPHPQSFTPDQGVYQPYFLLELRPAHWAIIPNAEYTRLDGIQGKEIRLNLQVVENQKVNINQDEINLLAYIYSFSNYDNKKLFSYGQPIGFLLDWLRGSHLRYRSALDREVKSLESYEESGTISLGILKEDGEYILQPIIVFTDSTLILEEKIEVLTANPIYLLYKNILYRVESNMPALFWINFFRLQQLIRIPEVELEEFINSFISKILPALDWQSLEEHLPAIKLTLTSSRIYLQERAGQFSPDVRFNYENIEFPAYPISEKSLASHGKKLIIVKRIVETEARIKRLLQKHGLLYIEHRWQSDPQYEILDWLRLQLPELEKLDIEILGEDNLRRYALKKGMPKLHLKVTSQLDWFKIKYKICLNKLSLGIPDFYEQLERNKNYMKAEDGAHIYFGERFTKKLSRFLKIIDNTAVKGSEKIRPTAFPLIEELIKLADEVDSDDEFKRWEKKYKQFKKLQEVELSNDFNGVLRDYQKSGLDWLSFLHRFHVGGILADDMGLGKTIQVIALLLNLKNNNKLGHPTLVVVPLTVLFNWENELKRFAPKLKVVRYQGQRNDREKISSQFHQFDVVLLSYGILLQDHSVLRNYHWDYLILDESQKIKNPSTKTYKAVKNFEIPHRLCLTGTPVENSVSDLWAQFNFLNPGMLGSLKQFESRFGKNGDDDLDNQEIFRRIIHPYILRRKKEDVIDELPERTDIINYVEMTERQSSIYQKGLLAYRDKILDQVETEGLPKTRMKILEALTYLRQIACHPAILDTTVAFEESGKVLLLEEMLDEIIQEGHKVLVFSQFVRFLLLAKRMVENKNWRYEYLDGSSKNRENIIQNFQENPEVKIFLISLKAGGLGLNLTAADYVIHLDPWWNPAVEQQATDRAHRIGQKNRVFVYKYIVKNSVEEKILKLQEQKKDLFNTLIPTEKSLIKQLTREDLRYLFEN
jgi:non-specific serine/threonine protein kinase